MAKTVNKIVLVPGWTRRLDKYLPLVAALRERGWEVKILPVPGLTGEELTRAWSLSDYAAWLEKQLLGEEEVILMGHSNGGRIILRYLADRPKEMRVKKVILLDSAGLVDNSLGKVVKRKIGKMVARIGKKWKDRPLVRRALYKILRERDYERATPVMRKTMAKLLEEDLRGRLAEIEQEALLIWGERDQETPLYLGEEMREKMTRARLKVIAGARHVPQFTHTAEVAALVEEFGNG